VDFEDTYKVIVTRNVLSSLS